MHVGMALLAATLRPSVTFHAGKAVIVAYTTYSNHPQLPTRYQIRPQH